MCLGLLDINGATVRVAKGEESCQQQEERQGFLLPGGGLGEFYAPTVVKLNEILPSLTDDLGAKDVFNRGAQPTKALRIVGKDGVRGTEETSCGSGTGIVRICRLRPAFRHSNRLGGVITTTNSTAAASDSTGPDRRRFYGAVWLP